LHFLNVLFFGHYLADYFICLLLTCSYINILWLRDTVVKRWSLSGELFLFCTQLAADG